MSTNSGCNITAHQVFGMCAAGDAARRLTQIEPQFRFLFISIYFDIWKVIILSHMAHRFKYRSRLLYSLLFFSRFSFWANWLLIEFHICISCRIWNWAKMIAASLLSRNVELKNTPSAKRTNNFLSLVFRLMPNSEGLFDYSSVDFRSALFIRRFSSCSTRTRLSTDCIGSIHESPKSRPAVSRATKLQNLCPLSVY